MKVFISSILIFFSLLKNVFSTQPAYIKFDETGYKISSGDTIEIRVLNEPECTVNQVVDSEGMIRIVYLGKFKVTEYTVEELELALKDKYFVNKIFRNPTIISRISSYSKRYVYLSGSFVKTGPFPLPPEAVAMNIVELINLSGGFSPIAQKKKVLVTRSFYDKNGSVQETKSYEINVDALSQGKTKVKGQKWWIYPGDKIHAPEKLF
jgi:protein involved in polysaccharide export with SLBB domain